jgi:hypothetical protein
MCAGEADLEYESHRKLEGSSYHRFASCLKADQLKCAELGFGHSFGHHDSRMPKCPPEFGLWKGGITTGRISSAKPSVGLVL